MDEEPNSCAQCGRPLRAAVPGAVCPRCLLQARDDDPDPSEDPTPLDESLSDAETLFTQPDQASPPPSAIQPGSEIGNYRLLERLGEGGMGVVWKADQLRPVKRTVALKVIKRGMDTEQVVQRFEAERQALAMMEHPNIATVFDAGETEEYTPYFVMEYVEGVPITEYCDEERLNIRERLDLFTSVCRAVQHAHQKGIIHRDLKPSNVLVTVQDGKPLPKVIDFGIAKATETSLTEQTFLTMANQVVGTPVYMSPEQASLNPFAVDTRADVYSLGALLYELLTGTPPISREALFKKAYDELLRIIREEEAPRPSTRLSDLGDQLRDVSAKRSLDPSVLAKRLRGELDWILLKSLEKDPNRRYESAQAFGDDLVRFLKNEPVSVGPPSKVYQARKWIRRNRAATVVIATVLLFSALSLTLFFRERAALGLADQRNKALNTRTEQLQETTGQLQKRTDDLQGLLKAESDASYRAGWKAWKEGKQSDGIAHWAQALKLQPQDPVKAARLVHSIQEARIPRIIPFRTEDGAEVRIGLDGSTVFQIQQPRVGSLQLFALDDEQTPTLMEWPGYERFTASSDGKFAVLTGPEKPLLLTDLGSRQTIGTWQGYTDHLFCADDSRLALTGKGQSLLMFDLATRKELWSQPSGRGESSSPRLSLSAGGKYLHSLRWYIDRKPQWIVRDLSDGTVKLEAQVRFSPTDQFAYNAAWDGGSNLLTVRVWDTTTWEEKSVQVPKVESSRTRPDVWEVDDDYLLTAFHRISAKDPSDMQRLPWEGDTLHERPMMQGGHILLHDRDRLRVVATDSLEVLWEQTFADILGGDLSNRKVHLEFFGPDHLLLQSHAPKTPNTFNRSRLPHEPLEFSATCVEIATGKVVWTIDNHKRLGFTGEALVLTQDNRIITAYGPLNQQPVWQITFPSPVLRSLGVLPGCLGLSTRDGWYAVDLRDGTSSVPLADENVEDLGSHTSLYGVRRGTSVGGVTVLEALSGKQLWKDEGVPVSSPQGGYVAITRSNGQFIIRETATGRELTRAQSTAKLMTAGSFEGASAPLSFTGDDRFASWVENKETVVCYNLRERRVQWRQPGRMLVAPQLSLRSEQFAVLLQDNSFQRVRIADGKPAGPQITSEIMDTSATPFLWEGASYLIFIDYSGQSGPADESRSVFDLTTGEDLSDSVDGGFAGLRWISAHARYAVCSAKDKATVIDLETRAELWQTPHLAFWPGQDRRGISYSSRFLASKEKDNSLTVYEVRSGEKVFDFPNVAQFEFTDSEQFAVILTKEGSLYAFDIRQLETAKEQLSAIATGVTGFAVSRDETRLAIRAADELTVFERVLRPSRSAPLFRKWGPVIKLPAGTDKLLPLRFSGDGTLLTGRVSNNEAFVVPVGVTRELWTSPDGREEIADAVFSRDGKFAVLRSTEGTMVGYRIASFGVFEEAYRLENIDSLQLGPAGERIITRTFSLESGAPSQGPTRRLNGVQVRALETGKAQWASSFPLVVTSTDKRLMILYEEDRLAAYSVDGHPVWKSDPLSIAPDFFRERRGASRIRVEQGFLLVREFTSRSRPIHMFDLATGKQSSLPGTFSIRRASIHPGRGLLAQTFSNGFASNGFAVADLHSGEIVFSTEELRNIKELTFSQRGNYLKVNTDRSSVDGRVRRSFYYSVNDWSVLDDPTTLEGTVFQSNETESSAHDLIAESSDGLMHAPSDLLLMESLPEAKTGRISSRDSPTDRPYSWSSDHRFLIKNNAIVPTYLRNWTAEGRAALLDLATLVGGLRVSEDRSLQPVDRDSIRSTLEARFENVGHQHEDGQLLHSLYDGLSQPRFDRPVFPGAPVTTLQVRAARLPQFERVGWYRRETTEIDHPIRPLLFAVTEAEQAKFSTSATDNDRSAISVRIARALAQLASPSTQARYGQATTIRLWDSAVAILQKDHPLLALNALAERIRLSSPPDAAETLQRLATEALGRTETFLSDRKGEQPGGWYHWRGESPPGNKWKYPGSVSDDWAHLEVGNASISFGSGVSANYYMLDPEQVSNEGGESITRFRREFAFNEGTLSQPELIAALESDGDTKVFLNGKEIFDGGGRRRVHVFYLPTGLILHDKNVVAIEIRGTAKPVLAFNLWRQETPQGVAKLIENHLGSDAADLIRETCLQERKEHDLKHAKRNLGSGDVRLALDVLRHAEAGPEWETTKLAPETILEFFKDTSLTPIGYQRAWQDYSPSECGLALEHTPAQSGAWNLLISKLVESAEVLVAAGKPADAKELLLAAALLERTAQQIDLAIDNTTGGVNALRSRAVQLPEIKALISEPIVRSNATWSWNYPAAGLPSGWQEPDHDISSWASGSAPLGYGENGLGTRLDPGPDPNSKPMTAYFATDFQWDGPADDGPLELKIRADDGAVVYLNSKEIARYRIAPGVPITPNTPAETLGGADELRVGRFAVDSNLLRRGTNRFAVEVHQCNPQSSDLVFSLELAKPFLTLEQLAPLVTAEMLQKHGGFSDEMTALWRATLQFHQGERDAARKAFQASAADNHLASLLLWMSCENVQNLPDGTGLTKVLRTGSDDLREDIPDSFLLSHRYHQLRSDLWERLERSPDSVLANPTAFLSAPLRRGTSGSWYSRLELPTSWSEAQALCHQLGGHLATATSKAENDFLYQSFGRRQPCWLGARRTGDDWKWVTGEPFEFTNWSDGEPSGTAITDPEEEAFLAFGTGPGYGFRTRWNDHAEHGRYGEIAFLYPLCEWKTEADIPDTLRKQKPVVDE